MTGQQTRIGLFNAILGVFGLPQVGWLQTFDMKLNTLFIILVFVCCLLYTSRCV